MIIYLLSVYCTLYYCRLKLLVTRNSEDKPYDEYTITVSDDVSSWNAGDKLVIASTDYDMNQSEEVEVISVISGSEEDSHNGNRLIIRGSNSVVIYGF